MAQLIIFTNNFPFGNGETFLETEIFFLAKYFASIHIFPLYYGQCEKSRRIPDNATYSEPFFKIDVVKNRGGLLSAGILNDSPTRFALKELLRHKVYLNFSHLKNWLSEVCIIRNILTITNREKIDSQIQKNSVLYFYWGDKSSGIVPFVKRKYQIPVVARFHNSDLYEEIKSGYIPFRSELLKNLTCAVFIAEKGEQYMKSRFQNIAFHSRVFRLGVNRGTSSKPVNDGILRIVSCSYVVPIKRIDLIIDSLNTLSFKIHWTHIGGGPLLEQIKEKSKSLQKNIIPRFLGHVKNKDVLDYYNNNSVDLFLNVSASEGIPVSIMEAIAAGIPVIATDVGGTSEIIHESFGKLIDKNFSVSYLAQLIKEVYLKSPEEKMMMRKAAIAFWDKNFNAEKNYTAFSMYLSTLN
ncbi:MAG: glycosyltransferase [Prolixibacteraceae bacterium]|nr:glycosyltransferase [Prolixibacteraceae bacterium]